MIGGVSPAITSQLIRATGRSLLPCVPRSRRDLYQRLQHADAAVVTIDHAIAVESRIPAKTYDYLATGVPASHTATDLTACLRSCVGLDKVLLQAGGGHTTGAAGVPGH